MQKSNQVAVVIVPFIAQSHLNQLLQLSCLIASSYPTPVYYVTSSIHLKQAKTRANGLSPSQIAAVRFHELPIEPFESPPPDSDSFNKFPFQLTPSWVAAAGLRGPFAAYLHEMSREFEKVVIIHDVMMSAVVQEVVSVENAESYAFNPISAFTMSSLVFQDVVQAEFCTTPLPTFEDCVPDEVSKFSATQVEPKKYRSGDLYNTVRSLEAPFLNLLAKEKVSEGRNIWAIGPMLLTKSSERSKTREPCLEWLDRHEPDSVIYVSFGTTTSLSDEQIRELALGLEESKLKFLWVLRDADKGNVFDGVSRRIELPLGFESRTEGVGLVIRDWAPQVDILAHPSTGGFVSHCGWNSCLESLTMGVPLATWPMHSDQPRNGYLVTDILKAGIVARDWAQRRELVKASDIADFATRLMSSEEGNVIRQRSREIGVALRGAAEEGGDSKVEMDAFIAHITRERL